MPTFTKTALLAYEDDRYGWTTGECSQGNCSEWGGGSERWGVLYFSGLSELKGLIVNKAYLTFTVGSGYSQGKTMYLYASKKSGISTSSSAESAYKGASLGNVTGLNNTTYTKKDITGIIADQIVDPASNTVNDTFVIHSASSTNYMKISTVSLTVEYTATTNCEPPTSFTGTPTTVETTIKLSWSGAKAGTANSITGYNINYRVSSNKSSWGDWVNLTTVSTTATSGSYSYTPNLTRGYYIQYRIQTRGGGGSGYYSSYTSCTQTARKNSLPTAPTTVSLSKSVVTSLSSVTLSWSGSSDPDQNLDGYRIEKTINGGTTWSLLKNISTTSGSGSAAITLTDKAGTTVSFRVRSEDSLNAVSGYKNSAAVVINSPPSTPSSLSLSSSLISSGSTVKLTWAAASDTNNNLLEYQLQKSVDNSKTWQTLKTIPAGTTTHSQVISNAAGTVVVFRVRAVDTLLEESGYRVSSQLKVNSSPTAPTIVTASKSVYNNGDSLELSWSGDSDIDNNIDKYEVQYYVGSSWVALQTTTARKISLKPTQAADGSTIKYRVRAVDSLKATSAYMESKAILRDDFTGIKVCINDKFTKGYIFVCHNGLYKKGEIFVCKNGTSFEKATD